MKPARGHLIPNPPPLPPAPHAARVLQSWGLRVGAPPSLQLDGWAPPAVWAWNCSRRERARFPASCGGNCCSAASLGAFLAREVPEETEGSRAPLPPDAAQQAPRRSGTTSPQMPGRWRAGGLRPRAEMQLAHPTAQPGSRLPPFPPDFRPQLRPPAPLRSRWESSGKTPAGGEGACAQRGGRERRGPGASALRVRRR